MRGESELTRLDDGVLTMALSQEVAWLRTTIGSFSSCPFFGRCIVVPRLDRQAIHSRCFKSHGGRLAHSK